MRRKIKYEVLEMKFRVGMSKKLVTDVLKVLLDNSYYNVSLYIVRGKRVYVHLITQNPDRVWELLLQKIGKAVFKKSGTRVVCSKTPEQRVLFNTPR